jgi:hypothetical protein
MKKTILAGSLLMLALVLAVPALYAQEQGGWTCRPWMAGGYQRDAQGGGWYCPWMGGGMGYGRTPGGQGQPQQQYAPGQTPGKPLTQEQTKTLVEDYLKNTNNPNLKLGALSGKGDVFEAEIVTKDGSRADKIQVDKNTGWFRSAY